jgi:uncharacterized protein (TIGR02246 family)
LTGKGAVSDGSALESQNSESRDVTERERIAREIQALLDGSAAAWSAGDLNEFMACYEESPETVYLGAAQIVSGYTGIRNMYAERFGMGGARSMGKLAMKVQRVKPLGDDYVLAIGQFSLTDRAECRSGMCSLVLHHTAQGWRICADHSA